MLKIISLEFIVIDAGTQVRCSLDEDTVEEYAEAWKEKVCFPPIDVFADGNRYILADGFHRFFSAQRAGEKYIEANIHSGTRQDAIKFAVGANRKHGLKMTRADKRKAVSIAFATFAKLSDRTIAEMCGVSNTFVGAVRQDLKADEPIRTAKDGSERKVPPPPPPRETVNIDGPKSKSIPKPPQTVDAMGYPIPTSCLPLWGRVQEVVDVLNQISVIKGMLRGAKEDAKDALWSAVNYSSALSHLDQLYADVKLAKPYAVCPSCVGQVKDQCQLCKGRGLLSEFAWDTFTTSEQKDMRLAQILKKK